MIVKMRNVSRCTEKRIKRFLLNISPPPHQKSCNLENNVEKCVRTRQDADGNMIRRMRFACWVTAATHTLRSLQLFLLFHYNSSSSNSHQYHVIRTLSVLFLLIWLSFPAVCWSPFYGKLHDSGIASSLWICQIWSNVKLSLVPTN